MAAKSPVEPGCGRNSKQHTNIVSTAISSEAWSQVEVEATVSDYFGMLEQEMKGVPVNKAEHNRLLQPLLQSRSRGAIEFKHQNISAILLELGYPYVSGYKPRRNYQELLRMVVAQRIAVATDFERTTSAAVEAPMEEMPEIPDLLSILVAPPPSSERRAKYTGVHEPRAPAPAAVNWLERESRNRSLAAAGEQLV